MKNQKISTLALTGLVVLGIGNQAYANSFTDHFRNFFKQFSQSTQSKQFTPVSLADTAQAPLPAISSIPAPPVVAPPVQVAVTTPIPSPTPIFDACSEMQIGESRTIDNRVLPANVNLYVTPGYLLIRDQDDSDGKQVYEAVLNINFVPKPGEDPSIADTIRAKTETCYAALPPMEGGSNQSLKIRFAKNGESAPVRNVNVTAQAMFREDMIDWSTQTSCPIIIHETLHLLGLVDVYQETLLKTSTGGSAYDCRKVGAPDSIMRSYQDAHLSIDSYTEHSCSCEDSNCAKEIAALSAPPATCPAGSEESTFSAGLQSSYDVATDPTQKAVFDQDYAPLLKGQMSGKWVYEFLTIDKNTQPLLYPGEFRMITAPGCQAKNQVYYQCATDAYLSSSTSGCKTEPSVCDDPTAWLQ